MIKQIKSWFTKEKDGESMFHMELFLSTAIDHYTIEPLIKEIAKIVAPEIKKELLEGNQAIEKLTEEVRKEIVRNLFK